MTRYEVEKSMKARARRDFKVILGLLLVLAGLAAVMTEF